MQRTKTLNKRRCLVIATIAFLLAAFFLFIACGDGDMDGDDSEEVVLDSGVILTLDGDGYTVNCRIDTSGDIVIPAEYNGKPVTSIASYAFRDNSGITSITIPNSVTRIGKEAFGFNSSLASIYYTGDIASWCKISGLDNLMPNGASLFIDGKELTGELIIPNSVTSIGSSAFKGCSSLTSVTFESNSKLTSIWDGAFSGCNGLTSVEIPNSVTEIGSKAFSGCSSLTSIEIPNGVIGIGSEAFSGCNSLTSIVIPNSVMHIGNGTFSDCPIENAKLPTTAIENIIHLVCSSLKTVIVDGGTYIGESAFRGCDSLTSIEIPNSVTSIGRYAFDDCPIENAKIPTTAISYIKNSALKTVQITGGTSIDSSAFSGCGNLTSIEIPNSVTSISGSAFSGCNKLIQTENGVKYVDKWAISCDASVSSVTLRDDTIGIGDRAFEDCSNLTNIEIPNTVTSIGHRAFEGCDKLIQTEDGVQYVDKWAIGCDISATAITLRDDTVGIGDKTFEDRSMLTIYCEAASKPSGWHGDWNSSCPVVWDCKNNDKDDNGYAYTVIDGIRYGLKDGEATVVRLSSNYITARSLIVPASIMYKESNYSVTSIGDGAFDTFSLLRSIEIPSSVTSIGDNAFRDCASLTSIEIPNGVTSIGDHAFFRCSKLTSIEIPNSVISIGLQAFDYCSYELIQTENGVRYVDKWAIGCDDSVTSIVLRDGTGGISVGAFWGCDSLTSIEIPNSVTSIGDLAFYTCSSLSSIEIPNSITSIGEYAFYGCSSLMSIEIPNSVTSIGDSAFSDCAGLTSIEIPNSVTSIGDLAFYTCSSLSSILIPSSVTSIGDYAFWDCDSLTIYCEVASKPSDWGGDWNDFYPVVWDCKNNDKDENGYAYTVIDGIRYGLKDGEAAVIRQPLNISGAITIPSSVTYKGQNYSVTRIEDCAFEYCYFLTSIVIPNSVTIVGNYAFGYCIRLTIRCEATAKPSDWGILWNYQNYNVVWDYKNK